MGFFDKLKSGLSKTKTSFDEKINNVFSGFRKVDEEFLNLGLATKVPLPCIFTRSPSSDKSEIALRTVLLLIL